jgi:hypothetical protein
VWRAQKEGRAELSLEAVEARGQGRLGDEESLGRAADAAPAGDLQKALDLYQLNSAGLAVT